MAPNKNLQKTTNNSVDIGELISFYLKYWKWFALSIFLCAAIAILYIKVVQPTYQLSSNILIKTNEKSGASSLIAGSSMMKSMGLGGLSGSRNIDDEVGILASHTLTKQMIMSLDLYKSYRLAGFFADKALYLDSPIVTEIDKNIIDTLSTSMKFNIKVNKDKSIKITGKIAKKKIDPIKTKQLPYTFHSAYGDVTFAYSSNPDAVKPESSSYTVIASINGADVATESFQKKIGIGLANKRSNIISLGTQDKIIPRGKDILNKLVELFNLDGLKDKHEEAVNTDIFIKDRLNIITSDLQKIEHAVEGFKKDNQLIDAKAEAELSLRTMETMKARLTDLEVRLSLVKMIEDYVKNPANQYKLLPAGLGVPDGLSKQILEYNEILMQRSSFLQDMHESNPTIVSLDEQIELLQKNIVGSVENVKRDIQKTKDTWQREERSLSSEINKMPTQERQFIEIQREFEIKNALYLFLLERQEENALTLASSTPKAKIIDKAFALNKPVAPKKKIILLVALLMGALLPILFLYLKQLLNFKIEDKTQVEKLTNVPVLGEICLDKREETIVVKEGETSSIAELFRLLRTNMQFVLTGANEKVILVTSSISGEGKSFFVINFSMSLCLLKKKKVVMIGLDIRNPKLAEYLSLPTSKGITNFLASETMKPEEVILDSNIHPNLSIVPAGPVPPNPAELLLSDRLDDFFAYLRENFDYVVVDTAPVGMVSDTFSLKRVSDATIYLTRAYYTDKSHLKLVETIVDSEKLKKVSLVINGTKTKQGYGYGYGQNEK